MCNVWYFLIVNNGIGSEHGLKRTVNKATDPLTVMLTEKNEQSENELPVFADFKTKLTIFSLGVFL